MVCEENIRGPNHNDDAIRIESGKSNLQTCAVEATLSSFFVERTRLDKGRQSWTAPFEKNLAQAPFFPAWIMVVNLVTKADTLMISVETNAIEI